MSERDTRTFMHLQNLKFPYKLEHIVNDPTANSINWNKCGSAIVIRYSLFRREFLEESGLFKTSSIASFVRQLNLYGFTKIRNSSSSSRSEDVHIFHHRFFRRDLPDLVQFVSRKSHGNQSFKKQTRPKIPLRKIFKKEYPLKGKPYSIMQQNCENIYKEHGLNEMCLIKEERLSEDDEDALYVDEQYSETNTLSEADEIITDNDTEHKEVNIQYAHNGMKSLPTCHINIVRQNSAENAAERGLNQLKTIDYQANLKETSEDSDNIPTHDLKKYECNTGFGTTSTSNAPCNSGTKNKFFQSSCPNNQLAKVDMASCKKIYICHPKTVNNSLNLQKYCYGAVYATDSATFKSRSDYAYPNSFYGAKFSYGFHEMNNERFLNISSAVDVSNPGSNGVERNFENMYFP